MSLISVHQDKIEGVNKIIENVEVLLQKYDVSIDRERMQAERTWLYKFAVKYNTIWYWSVVKNIPPDGKLVVNRYYFDAYVVTRTGPSTFGGTKVLALYIVPKKKEEC